MLYNCSRKIIKVCSRSVLEQTKVNSRTVLEQTITTLLELFLNHFKNNLEKFRDMFKMLNGTFFEGCSTIVHKSSKVLFRNCSRTNVKCSIIVLGNIFIFFVELYLNKSFGLGKSNCRTKLSHLTFYICPINILEHI